MIVSIREDRALNEPFCDECGKCSKSFDVEITRGQSKNGRQLARMFLCGQHLKELQLEICLFLSKGR